jgi:hypothetical protein
LADGLRRTIAEFERQQGRAFTEKEKALFRRRGEHRFQLLNGSRRGDVKAALPVRFRRRVHHAGDRDREQFVIGRPQQAPTLLSLFDSSHSARGTDRSSADRSPSGPVPSRSASSVTTSSKTTG